MWRLRTVLFTMGVATVLAAIVSLVPQPAEAHSSLTPEVSIDLSAHAEEEAHCHGALECVVTFFLEPLQDRTGSATGPEVPYGELNSNFRGRPLTRDPPIPILPA